MKDVKNIYRCLDNYMVRTPLLPYDVYLDMCKSKSDITKEFSKNKKIQEAISIASSSLYESLLKLGEKSKNINQVESSLLKYMIRMTTRTTPYGLFSGIGLGDFRKLTSINNLDLSSGFKYMRIDMEWAYKLLRNIESNDEILKKLKVCTNDTILKNGNRLDNVYVSNFGVEDTKNPKVNASIRFSEKVNIAIEESRQGIKIQDLIDILNPNEEFDIGSVFGFIKYLISNEYLITELRPPLINTNTTEYIVNKLKVIQEAKPVYDSLLDINQTIKLYNDTNIGDGIELYMKIVSKMESLCKCKNYLQVDFKKADHICSLNQQVKDNIEKLADIMVKLAPINESDRNLNEFALAFSEKYGTYREVNILEVLDIDKGLGFPNGYISEYNYSLENNFGTSMISQRFHEVLSMKLNESLNDKSNEILLDDKDIDYICQDSKDLWNKANLPKSFDINIFIKSEDINSIDNGEYEFFIGPNVGSSYAGKMLGRFSHMFDDKLSNYFSQIDKAVSELEEDVILVEVSEMLTQGRIANVCKNYNNREYELTIATNKSELTKKISLQDVYVGVDDKNKLYFKSKKLNKKILFTANNMLNPKVGSNIYRFIREVSESSNIDIFSRICDIGINDLSNIPRVKYENIVLSPAKWKLGKHNINLGKNNDLNLINIKKFIEKNKVPRYVYIGTGDNRLVIDTTNNKHLNEIICEIKKEGYNIELTELEFTENHMWMKDNNGKSYISEFVFSLTYNGEDSTYIEKKEVINTKSDISKNKNLVSTYSDKRVSGLFNDWMYFKFYGTDKRMDEFLGIELVSFLAELDRLNIIDKYFYLRYRDSRNHIRLRIKLTSEDVIGEFIKIINEFINTQIKKGLISDVNMDMYFKEIERYGGIESHIKVEQAFYDDSWISMNLISLKRNNIIKKDNILIACINTVHILESMGLKFEEQNMLFQSLFDKKDERDLFREKSKDLLFYCNSDNEWENLRSCNEGMQIYNIIKNREDSFKEFWCTVNEEDEKGKLLNDKVNILMSKIHMFCNRFLNSRDEETVTLQLVRHTLHALEYKKKYGNKAKNE